MKVTIHWHNSEIYTNTDTPIQHGVPLDDYEECKDLKPSALSMSPEYWDLYEAEINNYRMQTHTWVSMRKCVVCCSYCFGANHLFTTSFFRGLIRIFEFHHWMIWATVSPSRASEHCMRLDNLHKEAHEVWRLRQRSTTFLKFLGCIYRTQEYSLVCLLWIPSPTIALKSAPLYASFSDKCTPFTCCRCDMRLPTMFVMILASFSFR